MPPRSPRNLALATFAITSIALFMVSLDNLVVTTALPVIKQSLGATLSQLEWMVNAYTLTFAVLLLTGAALGDRFGRKRVFTAGVALFTAGSAFAALAPSGDMLVLARAIQGVGAAVVTPLTLTILSSAVPKERRGLALGLWGAIAGLAIALGPLVGGAIVQGLSWQWIFWLNVPLGIVLVPLAAWQLQETHGPDASIDLPGLGLASTGLFALVWALIHGNEEGWTSAGIVGAFVAAANTVSLLMSFGMFGSIFLLAQFFQIVQGYSPFEAGLRTLPWTAMPIVVAPIAGVLSDRVGSRPLLVIGMALMAVGLGWIAAIATPTVEYLRMVPAFVLAGTGMSMFFAPTANLVLSSVHPDEEGRASGANNTIREIGGVFGVAVLASVFAANGSYVSPQAFVDGMVPAVWVGAAAVALASVVALAVPGRRLLAGVHLPEAPAMPELRVARP